MNKPCTSATCTLCTTARALAEALEQAWVGGDEDGNPVCASCGSHLDGEYAHHDDCLLASPAVRALLEPTKGEA